MGTQPASFLTSLEEDLDRPIGEYFDLIAGTSTGGILAIGLAMPTGRHNGTRPKRLPSSWIGSDAGRRFTGTIARSSQSSATASPRPSR